MRATLGRDKRETERNSENEDGRTEVRKGKKKTDLR